jgi:hypothetical protein
VENAFTSRFVDLHRRWLRTTAVPTATGQPDQQGGHPMPSSDTSRSGRQNSAQRFLAGTAVSATMVRNKTRPNLPLHTFTEGFEDFGRVLLRGNAVLTVNPQSEDLRTATLNELTDRLIK